MQIQSHQGSCGCNELRLMARLLIVQALLKGDGQIRNESQAIVRFMASSTVRGIVFVHAIIIAVAVAYGFFLKRVDTPGSQPLFLPASAQSKKNLTETKDALQEVSVCQVAQDPGKFNHKLIKLTAFLSHGFEDSGLFDPGCDSRFSIWLEYGGTNSSGTMYCCGVTAERERPKQILVENIPIPLIVDDNFRSLDKLLHGRRPDSIVHATVVGRFFSGEKTIAANGRDWWQGYGHMGCCSLFMLQQVISVDQQNRTDLDYGASADQPGISESGCGYSFLLRDETFNALIEAQRVADLGERSWAFEDPQRVAAETLARLLKREENSIKGITLKRQAKGRMVYEWATEDGKAIYMVVVSRPYSLSFFAKQTKVAWVPTAAYKSSCGAGNSVTLVDVPGKKTPHKRRPKHARP